MNTHSEALRLKLAKGPESPRALCTAQGISQPTLSRALTELEADVVRIGAARSIRYALRDDSRGFATLPVYRIDPEGRLHRMGALTPIRPDGYVMHQDDGQVWTSEGLPWWLLDMRPQGFLGRAFARSHATHLGLPASVAEWSDAQALRALMVHGHDAVGNLLLGDVARERFLSAAPTTTIQLPDKPSRYLALAQSVLHGDSGGSSAGGEQPKFTAVVHTEVGPRHVLVKFSLDEQHAVAVRWRDLLLAEHLALETLRESGLSAARSWVVDEGTQRFLEVERFDRVGTLGRRGLFSLAALEAEFVGDPRSPWPVLVDELVRQKVVDRSAALGVQQLFAFGRLIGNTDMHNGNLSFIGDTGRPYSLAPAYDMLPMAFAPTSSGAMRQDVPAITLHPHVHADVWKNMLVLAQRYLKRLQSTDRFSDAFAPCVQALVRHLNQASEMMGRLA